MLIRKSWQKQTNKTKGNAMKNSKVIAKIKEWLEDEVNQYEKYTFDDYEDADDLDVALSRGRHESAENLYNQIHKWEKE